MELTTTHALCRWTFMLLPVCLQWVATVWVVPEKKTKKKKQKKKKKKKKQYCAFLWHLFTIFTHNSTLQNWLYHTRGTWDVIVPLAFDFLDHGEKVIMYINSLDSTASLVMRSKYEMASCSNVIYPRYLKYLLSEVCCHSLWFLAITFVFSCLISILKVMFVLSRRSTSPLRLDSSLAIPAMSYAMFVHCIRYWHFLHGLQRPRPLSFQGRCWRMLVKEKKYASFQSCSWTHYENTPIQIYRKFHLQKLKIFR